MWSDLDSSLLQATKLRLGNCLHGLLCVCGTATLGNYKGRVLSWGRQDVKGQPDGKDSKMERESSREELVNALIEAQWTYISGWFEQLMRDTVEPALQGLIPGLSIKFGSNCSLGRKPLRLENSVVSRSQGESKTNLQIVGEVDYHGDVEVEVEITGGRLKIIELEVKGKVIIDFVELTTTPPWFSGLRVCFPNAPEVDLTADTALMGLSINFDFIETKLTEVIRGLIVDYAVLPNCFAIKLLSPVDTIRLQQPSPLGVLRIQLLNASLTPHMPTDRSWWQRVWRNTCYAVDPFVELVVGATTYTTDAVNANRDPEADAPCFDFLVNHWEQQLLRVTVRDGRDGPVIGYGEQVVQELIACSSIPLSSQTSGGGFLYHKAECRAFNELVASHNPSVHAWGIGANKSTWLLSVDVLYAAGLPPCRDNTEHWAEVTVTCCKTQERQMKESFSALARTASDQGRELMVSHGIPAKLFEQDAKFARALWEKKVYSNRVAPRSDQDQGLVDAVWNYRFFFLLDLPRNEVEVRIKRAKEGKTRTAGGYQVGLVRRRAEEAGAGWGQAMHLPSEDPPGGSCEVFATFDLRGLDSHIRQRGRRQSGWQTSKNKVVQLLHP